MGKKEIIQILKDGKEHGEKREIIKAILDMSGLEFSVWSQEQMVRKSEAYIRMIFMSLDDLKELKKEVESGEAFK